MINSIDLVCPNCQKHFKGDIYSLMNVQLDQGIKEKVLSGTLFDFTCSHCHETFHVEYPCLYHDMDSKLMIQFVLENEDKPFQDIPSEYTYRIVDSYKSLIEKVLIFDSGLDDRYMELYKLVVLSQYEDSNNVNGLYYWLYNNEYVITLDEKESNVKHYMPFNKDVYDMVKEVFADDLSESNVIDPVWAMAQTKEGK